MHFQGHEITLVGQSQLMYDIITDNSLWSLWIGTVLVMGEPLACNGGAK